VSDPTIVCILGMHRSGTSLVSRLMNVLGLDLGPEEHLMEPNASNPAGHWESLPISEINEDIFVRLGGSWAVPPPMPADWERSPELADLRRQARELIAADFSDSDLWGFKDPRTCLTAPFWQRLLPPMRYLICLRNPIDVATSLEGREEESVPFDQGLELWFGYVRSSLSAAAGHPHEFVFYEDLMADPEPVVARLARFLGRSGPERNRARIRKAINVAVSESLWHHQTAAANVIDADGLGFPVKALYAALRLYVPAAEAAGIEVLDLLGAYAGDAGAYVSDLEADRARLEEVYERAQFLDREVSALEEKLEGQTAELQRVSASHREEQRLRRRLEAQIRVTGAELGRRRRPEPTPATAEQTRESGETAARKRLETDIQARTRELIPAGATVLVAAKGDDALMRLNDARAWHFPATADGRYAGYHPAGDTAVIAQLEASRARGADHLVLPTTTLWWLDHYSGLRRHLEDRYLRLLKDETCAIYRLSAPDRSQDAGSIAALRRIAASVRIRSGREPSILDWDTELRLGEHLAEMPVFVPPGEGPTLPYLDRSVDVVVLASTDPGRIAEARRVAGTAVIRFDPSTPERSEIEWLGGAPSGWGRDVIVTLIPGGGDAATWRPTITGFAETLAPGFEGVLSVVGDPAELELASERAAAAGVSVRPIEVGQGESLPDRARRAIEGSDQRIHVMVAAPAVPLPGWLPPILALFSNRRDAGVVGTRTLFGDGTLAEAGGVLAADGSRLRRGGGDHDPDRPEYCHVRGVDFCSPPLLATSRDVYERLSGFDDRRLHPDDALIDFSLRATDSGASVYYQPGARVVALGKGGR
jgi:hypothetical protein